MNPQFAVYFRQKPWEGPWQLFTEIEMLEIANHHLGKLLDTVAVRGEACIFTAPKPPSHEWPKRFTDGSEPGRLVYQITAVYRQTLEGLRRGG